MMTTEIQAVLMIAMTAMIMEKTVKTEITKVTMVKTIITVSLKVQRDMNMVGHVIKSCKA